MVVTTKIREGLKNLQEKTNEPEMVEMIAGIVGSCDNADKDYESLINQHAELKQKYSDLVRKESFPTPPKGTDEEVTDSKTIEEVAQEILDQQK